MPRMSQQETITLAVQQHLAIGEAHSPDEYPLTVRAVARTLHVSPTTLYKYHLEKMIAAACMRQKQRIKAQEKPSQSGTPLERLANLRAELERVREQNQGLIAQIVLMEGNAARLGFDADQLYQPLPKPLRSSFRAGKGSNIKPYRPKNGRPV